MRFKGREKLSANEASKWQFSRDEKEVTAPNVDTAGPNDPSEHKFTFDHVLTDCAQDKFYRLSAEETVR